MAALAIQNVKYPFTTVDELAEDTQYKIAALAGGAHASLLQVTGVHELFQNETLSLYQMFWWLWGR